MKKIIIAFLLISMLSNRANASDQMGEYLIIGKDTIEIDSDPIYNLDKVTYDLFLKSIELTKDFKEISRCLYTVKGYQGVWKIQNSSLYLVDLDGYSDARKIFKKVFPDSYKNGKVLADWFSSQIVIPRGNLLRSFWDTGEATTHLKEEILYFKTGMLINRISVDNYVDLENGISRLNPEKLRDTLISLIKTIDRPEMIIRYTITIDSNGKISDIEFDGLHRDYKHWQNYFKEKLRNYQFDIIKEKGLPCSEKIFLEIF